MGFSSILFDFSEESDVSQWHVVNDGVMGGLSEGQLLLNQDGHGIFKGNVSLANNGGFSSLRFQFEAQDIRSYEHIIIRLKGDGKRYQFRVKDDQNQRHSYIQYFETSGEWQALKLKLTDLYPWSLGIPLRIPNYNGTSIGEIAFLIGNKKAESFELIIDKISLE